MIWSHRSSGFMQKTVPINHRLGESNGNFSSKILDADRLWEWTTLSLVVYLLRFQIYGHMGDPG